jgi:hypothetical protein
MKKVFNISIITHYGCPFLFGSDNDEIRMIETAESYFVIFSKISWNVIIMMQKYLSLILTQS